MRSHDRIPARIVFQPIVDLALWRVVGFEALARFGDGVSPVEHLQRATDEGRREELELHLIELAVAASAAFPSLALITLNASGGTIMRSALAEVLGRGERVWGLELYEGSSDEDSCDVRRQVSRLGGLLLIDDAGTAFSVEPRIRELDPDIVKIDRGLLWEAVSDEAARERIDGIVRAAADVQAKVLAEGVESEEHLELARALGADLLQGYLFGVPTAPEGIRELLDDLHRSVGVDAPGL